MPRLRLLSINNSKYVASSGVTFSGPVFIDEFSKDRRNYEIGNRSRRVCNLLLSEEESEEECLITRTVDVPFIGANLENGFRSLPSMMAKFRNPGDRIFDYCALGDDQTRLSVATRSADFIADAVTLAKIAMTPYQQGNATFSWSLNCFRVGKAILISTIETDVTEKFTKTPRDEVEFTARYRREKFLRLCCGEEDDDIFITPEAIIESRHKCYRVSKSYLTSKSQKLRLFYASEEYCVRDDQKQQSLLVDVYEEEGLGKGKDWPSRSLQWYLEAQFAGVDRALIGLVSTKRDDGRLTRVVDVPLAVLAKRSKWEVDKCHAFLQTVLLKIRDFILLEDLFIDAEFDERGALEGCKQIPPADEFLDSLHENCRQTRRETNVVHVQFRAGSSNVEFSAPAMRRWSRTRRNGAPPNATANSKIPPCIGRNRASFLPVKFRQRFGYELSHDYY